MGLRRVITFRRLAMLAPCALVLASCNKDEVASVPPPLVQTVVVGAPSMPMQRFTGTVKARTESTLGFRVGGKVVERLVDPGQQVKRGQALLRLDKADLDLGLRTAQAGVEGSQALATKTAADLRRSRDGSARERDQMRAAADAASAQLEASQAQAKMASNQLGYAELQADADGVVVEVAAEPGQVVGVGQPVVRLARDGAREAEIFLPESSARMARAEASAALFATHERAFPATLRELSAAADPATRSYRARYQLGGEGAGAPLGATVTVSLKTELRGSGTSVAVPLGAVIDLGEGTGVWVVDANGEAVAFRPVTIARMTEEAAEIATGLAQGERIVALGAHLLSAGQRVRVAPEAAKVAEAGR